ncbi:PREDICTED: uncharacterized protein LOC104810224 [Tarenaya hassleriana]|uniref:uncharacterized protein LOC104810224 n=1 Tax=Tarenaya hassleriana TaxID=28532 RepID=UPI00053C9E6C|nr:PREDICTED: uncharacterized protein LOC104810224 [Tarenaya hassleriana]
MVQDAFPSQYNDQVTEDPMNEASKKFFDLLEAANQPIYDGCKEGLSQLSASARLMGMKTSYNLTENCMNEVCQMLNDYLPQGRLSGKSKERWLSVEEWRHAHTYVLLNCDEIRPIERVFDEETKRLNPDMSDEECIDLKESSFAAWLQNYVSHSSENFPIWIQDLIRGPSRMVKCWPIMFTRGYTFHTYAHDSDRKTSNYGICVKGANCCDVADEPDFYGILQDIMVLEYHGYIGLKMVIFNCDWFDPTIGRGMRRNGSGGFDINLSKYSKYDPFILSSQADQVCYISYPTSKRRRDHWRAVIKIQPRGVVREEEGSTDIPFQERRIDDDIGQQFRITYSQNEQLVVSN